MLETFSPSIQLYFSVLPSCCSSQAGLQPLPQMHLTHLWLHTLFHTLFLYPKYLTLLFSSIQTLFLHGSPRLPFIPLCDSGPIYNLFSSSLLNFYSIYSLYNLFSTYLHTVRFCWLTNSL